MDTHNTDLHSQTALLAAGRSNDLKMDKKAGLTRNPPAYKDEEVYIWEDFKEYGFTRTLPETWINELP